MKRSLHFSQIGLHASRKMAVFAGFASEAKHSGLHPTIACEIRHIEDLRRFS